VDIAPKKGGRGALRRGALRLDLVQALSDQTADERRAMGLLKFRWRLPRMLLEIVQVPLP
jgi:hypothetical protein